MKEEELLEIKQDELYEKIKEFVLKNNILSISKIQIEFSIGYARANRILSALKEEKYI